MNGRARNSKLLLRQNLLLSFLIDALFDEHFDHGLIKNGSFLRHRAQFIQHELKQLATGGEWRFCFVLLYAERPTAFLKHLATQEKLNCCMIPILFYIRSENSYILN